MPQSTRRWISQKVQSLRESNVLPFHDILDAEQMCWDRAVKLDPDALQVLSWHFE